MAQEKTPKPAGQQDKIIIACIIIGIAGLIFFVHAILSGTFFGGCIYTEQLQPLPQWAQNSTIKMEQDMYLIKGVNKSDLAHCTESFNNINNEISTYSGDNKTGRSTEFFPAGKSFTIKKVISETEHGLYTIDSGPGPLVYLILEDEQGTLYQIAAVWLGMTNEPNMPRFGYYQNGKRIGTIYADMFQKF